MQLQYCPQAPVMIKEYSPSYPLTHMKHAGRNIISACMICEQINYEDFVKVGGLVSPRCHQFFRASAFLHFQQDAHHRIRIASFCEYVMKTGAS